MINVREVFLVPHKICSTNCQINIEENRVVFIGKLGQSSFRLVCFKRHLNLEVFSKNNGTNYELFMKFVPKENVYIPNFIKKQVKSLVGLYRARAANYILGSNNLFKVELELKGTGFKADCSVPKKITMKLGYTHPVIVTYNSNIEVISTGSSSFLIQGCDIDDVTSFAAIVKRCKPVNIYKGSGILKKGENVSLKSIQKKG